jgi:peptide chain release factor subunit 3
MQCLLLEQSNVKVIGINLDEKKVRRAGPGENVRVKLSGIEEDDIMAGFVLSSVGKYILQEKLI